MGRVIKWIVLLLVLLFGLLFATLNSGTIQLNFYLGEVELPLAVTLVIALALGAVLGVASTVGIILRLRRQLGRARKELRNSQKELSSLRSMPIKE